MAIVEFSGRCLGNPIEVSRNLAIIGGRVVSYDPGTDILTGKFRVSILETQDVEKKQSFFIEKILRDMDDCRVWVRILLDTRLERHLRSMTIMKISSGDTKVLVVRLTNYVYALWSRKGAGVIRLTPLALSTLEHPGDLTELAYPCEKLPELMSKIRKDLSDLVLHSS